MYGLWIALVGALLLAVNLAVTVPEKEHQQKTVAAEVAATNFYAYRTAVIDYINTHSGATGTIADSSLTFLPGYIRDTRWTHLIQSGTLYVYSTVTTSMESVSPILFQKGGKSLLIGKKAASGNLVSADGRDSGMALPAAIPVGAIVVVGS